MTYISEQEQLILRDAFKDNDRGDDVRRAFIEFLYTLAKIDFDLGQAPESGYTVGGCKRHLRNVISSFLVRKGDSEGKADYKADELVFTLAKYVADNELAGSFKKDPNTLSDEVIEARRKQVRTLEHELGLV